MLTTPPPASATISVSLTADEYALVVAALRTLEDLMQDCDDDEAAQVADECVALRAKLRAACKDRRPPALAVVIPIRGGSAP